MFSFGNKDKSQQPLLADDHLSTPPGNNRKPRHKSMGADPETGQSYLSKSTSNQNRNNNNNNLDLPDINKIALSTSQVDDEFDDDLHADSGAGSGVIPRDVLSDSEYVNTHPLENYEQRPIPIPIIDDVDDESQSIDDHNDALSESEPEHTPTSLSHLSRQLNVCKHTLSRWHLIPFQLITSQIFTN